MSFRNRLLLTSLLTLAVGLGALLVAGNVLLDRRVEAEASSLLSARAQAQLAALDVSATGVRVRPGSGVTAIDRVAWVLSGDRVVQRPAAVPADLERFAVGLGRSGRVQEGEGPQNDLRLRSQPVLAPGTAGPVGAIVVSLPVGPQERLQQEVLAGSLVIAVLVMLAGGVAIRGAVEGALEPVATMTERAAAWGAHDLDRRFDLGEAKDELTGLGATLDGLLARIAASRRHEQRFAGEMAHELRTPLARIRARTELALATEGSRAAAEREDALRLVLAQTEELTHTIDSLLAVARQELDPSGGTVDLAAIAREVPDVDVVGDAGLPRAEGEADVVRRALAPLVDNARDHAAQRVVLELSAAGDRVRLTVRDDGPGTPAELGERLFDPGARGPGAADGGAGLGLALARRLARSCGGDVRCGPGPGGCFILELPAIRTGASPP